MHRLQHIRTGCATKTPAATHTHRLHHTRRCDRILWRSRAAHELTRTSLAALDLGKDTCAAPNPAQLCAHARRQRHARARTHANAETLARGLPAQLRAAGRGFPARVARADRLRGRRRAGRPPRGRRRMCAYLNMSAVLMLLRVLPVGWRPFPRRDVARPHACLCSRRIAAPVRMPGQQHCTHAHTHAHAHLRLLTHAQRARARALTRACAANA
jgi:hypothetical protein